MARTGRPAGARPPRGLSPLAYQVLSAAQVDGFIARGWTRLEEAFPRAAALAVQDYLWERVAERGPRRADPATWSEPMVHIKESYREDVFTACATERLAGAIEDLVGRGRWAQRDRPAAWGWWPVNFALGADRPWDVPTGGWHWDGQHFRHFVDAPDQGLLLLCVFSDVRPQGGGTLVAEGSHQVVADFLRGHPEGLGLAEAIQLCNRRHPWLTDLTGARGPVDPAAPVYAERAAAAPVGGRVGRFMGRGERDAAGRSLRVIETVASAGDVFLCHPFLYHAASQNHLRVPRFMCNRTTPLRERLRFDRADPADHSPLEESIRQALGPVA